MLGKSTTDSSLSIRIFPAVETMCSLLRENRAGRRRGIYSVCSANRLVIEAAFIQAASDQSPLLIEATSNQVNQDDACAIPRLCE